VGADGDALFNLFSFYASGDGAPVSGQGVGSGFSLSDFLVMRPGQAG